MNHSSPKHRFVPAFTLLEVMIAVGVLGIAMMSLLTLHRQNLEGIIVSQDMSKAAMLAQGLMTEAELQRFPPVGKLQGNFDRMYPGQYRNFRWMRVVLLSPQFPDICSVEVTIFYGKRLSRKFSIIEYLHNPEPIELQLRGTNGSTRLPPPSLGGGGPGIQAFP